jgi:hypothetical protein
MCTYSPIGRLPAAVVQGARRLILSSRIAPLAIMGGTGRPGPRQGRLRRRSAIEQARPWTRAEPNLRSAAIGAMREDWPCA